MKKAEREARKKEAERINRLRAIGADGGNARAEAITPDQASEIARQGGLIGGRARAEALSPARRSEIARKAALARFASMTPEQRQAQAKLASEAAARKRAEKGKGKGRKD